MNIFDIDDIIIEVSHHFNYKALHHLLKINHHFNNLIQYQINRYDEDHILKELNINVILSHYKTKFPHKITHQYCKSYDTGNTLISCTRKTSSINTIIKEIVKENHFNHDCDVKLISSTLKFNHPMIKNKYNILPNFQKGGFNCKILHYNQIKVKIFPSGDCRLLLREQNNFSTYKQFINYLINYTENDL
jgi:hypothetical protein